MTFRDTANLARDQVFQERLSAALTTESMGKPDDALADAILKDPAEGSAMFMPLISSAPGFGDKFAAGGQDSITDGDMLAAIQANWQRVVDLYDLE